MSCNRCIQRSQLEIDAQHVDTGQVFEVKGARWFGSDHNNSLKRSRWQRKLVTKRNDCGNSAIEDENCIQLVEGAVISEVTRLRAELNKAPLLKPFHDLQCRTLTSDREASC